MRRIPRGVDRRPERLVATEALPTVSYDTTSPSVLSAIQGSCEPSSRRYDSSVTRREKLHQLVDELSETELEAALTRRVREREAVERWAKLDDTATILDAWAQANAREAIREEPW